MRTQGNKKRRPRRVVEGEGSTVASGASEAGGGGGGGGGGGTRGGMSTWATWISSNSSRGRDLDHCHNAERPSCAKCQRLRDQDWGWKQMPQTLKGQSLRKWSLDWHIRHLFGGFLLGQFSR